jgi:hypothetical protein
MHGSRNNRRVALLAAALVFGTAGLAWAQQEQPKEPPQEQPMSLQPPTRLAPPPPAADAPAAGPGQLDRRLPAYKTGPGGQSVTTLSSVGATGIEVDRLQVVTPDSAGIMSAETGGFGGDMWRGTPRARALAMLDALPYRTQSPTLTGLVRRLLLSAAEPPAGDTEPGALAVVRLSRLAAMGDYAGALDLLSVMPRQGRGPELVQGEAELRFLSGDLVAGCALVGNEVRRSQRAFWQKALVFCQLLSGQREKAELGLTLLREVGEADPEFFRLADAMMAGPEAGVVETGALERPSALALAMLGQMQAIVDPASLPRMAPGALRVVALNDRLPVALRLAAIEHLAGTRVFGDSALEKVYIKTIAALPAPEADAEQAWSDAERRVVQRARLFATAKRANIAVAKAEALSQAMQLAATDGRLGAAARLYKPELTQIPVSFDFKWFGVFAYLGAMVNGDDQAAEGWLNVLRRAAALSDEDAPALQAIAPVAAVAAADGDKPAGLEPRRTVLLDALLEALGADVDAERWLQRLGKSDTAPPPMAPPALWFALRAMNAEAEKDSTSAPVAAAPVQATADIAAVTVQALGAPTAGTRSDVKRKAEHMLLMVQALGSSTPGGANPIVLGEVVRGLRVLGFAEEARALALEAVMEVGL